MSMRSLQLTLMCTAIAGTTPLALCRDDPVPGSGSEVGISLPAQVELARLVDLVATRTGAQISYDPQELGGSITLRSSAALSNEALCQLVNDLLASKGLTTVLRPGSSTYSVVKVSEAAAAARMDSEAFDPSPALPFRPGFVSRRIALVSATPSDVVEQVKLLLGPATGKVATTSGSSYLVVSDLSPRVDDAIQLIAKIDRDAGHVVTAHIASVNVPASQLASAAMSLSAKLNQPGSGSGAIRGEIVASPTSNGVILVCPASEEARWHSILELLDRPQESITKVYSLKRFPLAEVASLVDRLNGTSRVSDVATVVRDELTSSLIVTASPRRQEEIGTLIDRLESTPGDGSRPVREFAIKNRPVNELLSTLNSMIAAGAVDAIVDASAAAGPDRQQLRASSEQAQLEVEAVGGKRVRGTATDSATAAVSQSLANDDHARLSAGAEHGLSLTVDAATNTMIAVGSPRQLAQLERIIERLDVRQPQVMVEVMLVSLSESDTLSLGVELDKLDTVGDARLRLASLFGLSSATGQAASLLGGSAAVFSPGEFSVLVRALQNLNKGRSVSIPRVLVNNNQAASFGSTVQQPFATSNATNSSTTITFGGSQSAGTTISVTPQISEGDHLVLTYNVSLSSFVGSPSSTGLPPPRQENRIDSVATIPDGYTVAVGGLDLSTNTAGTAQVPLIAEIPLVGELFKSRDLSSSKSRFFVFIRANVMRHDTMLDIKYVSEQERSRAGIDADWPQVKPQVIR